MAQDSLREWLAGHEADAMLRRAAASALKEITSRGIPLACVPENGRAGASTPDALEEIRQELALFILERGSLFEKILGPAHGHAHLFLKTAFINHLISRSRTPDLQPFRYLYKRASGVLKASALFFTRAQPKRSSVFSMASDSVHIPPLTPEEFLRIAPPDPAVRIPPDGRLRKKLLIDLAGRFWKEVSALFGHRPVWVRVSDLVSWIGSLTGLPSGPKTLSLEEEGSSAGRREDPASATETLYFDPAAVRRWAGQFHASLDGAEKTALYLRHGASLGLREIAGRLGARGASGAAYRVERAEAKLKYFLRDLPWLSPDDLNEEAFSLFWETLLSCLKKTVSGSY